MKNTPATTAVLLVEFTPPRSFVNSQRTFAVAIGAARNGYDDFSPIATGFEIADGVGCFNDRPDVAGLNQCLEELHVLAGFHFQRIKDSPVRTQNDTRRHPTVECGSSCRARPGEAPFGRLELSR
jgi:hypothetical protein